MSRDDSPGVRPFEQTLEHHGLSLVRGTPRTLQINLGRLCDLACRHCHLSAGPGRREVMDRATMEEVVGYARRVPFELIDITGGAPELVPDLPYLLEELAPLTRKLLLRSNLTALAGEEQRSLIALCRRLQVAIVASFPATNPGQTEAQRGPGVWDKSVEMLRRLNHLGYGLEGSGLELHLVANPAGAFLPQGQAAAERQFRRTLADRLGIAFNNLFVFANMPLGRFRQWLELSGNFDTYMARLAQAFNPCTVEGLMCRSLVSVAWDGTLYDCDFNQAAVLPLSCRKVHVRDMQGAPEPGSPIAVGDHCYACTAGAGFT